MTKINYDLKRIFVSSFFVTKYLWHQNDLSNVFYNNLKQMLFFFLSENCPRGLQCKHGGYIGPNCACTCPLGLTGRECTQVVHSSSGTLISIFYLSSKSDLRHYKLVTSTFFDVAIYKVVHLRHKRPPLNCTLMTVDRHWYILARLKMVLTLPRILV